MPGAGKYIQSYCFAHFYQTNGCLSHFYRRKGSCGKVMFSQVSFCPRRGGGHAWLWGGGMCGREHVVEVCMVGATHDPPPPPADGWNADLLCNYLILLPIGHGQPDNSTVFLYIILVPVHRYNGTI